MGITTGNLTQNTSDMVWRFDVGATEWDRHLAQLGGHPLQSALWGDSRRRVDGIDSEQWGAFDGEAPVLMARIESRPAGPFGKVAWVPKGPTTSGDRSAVALAELLRQLRRRKFLVCIDDPYHARPTEPTDGTTLQATFPTAFIDLQIGRDALLANIDSKTRYGIRSAEKAKVTVEQSRDPADVSAFFTMCAQVSKDKRFSLPGSEPLMQALCAHPLGGPTEARLFVARVDGQPAAGALILRCGASMHYFWGALDRAFVKQHPSEAVQWAVIQWGAEHGVRTYDLEGIDRVGNPGTAQFKMKLGATEVPLPARHAYPLGLTGRLALKAGLWLGKIS